MDFKLNKSNLNFSVRIADAVPTNPGKENDIAVISSVPMKNWILSPDTPTGAPRTDGDVCIPYSVNGTVFNAIKNGGLMIAPMMALQYVDGAWVKMPTYLYRNGKWNELMPVIPNEYQAVEYLESTGSQYINTGLDTDDGKTGIKLKAMFNSLEGFAYGLRKDSSYSYFSSQISGNSWFIGGANGSWTNTSLKPSTNVIYDIQHNYKGSSAFAVNGETVINNLVGVPKTSLTMFLFGENKNGSIANYLKMRLYGCEMTSGNDVVRHFIPCYRKSDSVAGLYDTVNNVFYTNSGSGSFNVGGAV